MPAGDRTGPWGQGPRTGRGLGFCSGYAAPGYANPAPGMGWGRGLGLGRGFGRGIGRGLGMGMGMGMGRGRRFRHPGAWGFWGFPPAGAAYAPPINEEAALADEAVFLEAELSRIKERLDELRKAQEEKQG